MRNPLHEEHGQYDIRESYRHGVFVDEFGIENPHVIAPEDRLAKAAKKAATTGNRKDLHEYLKLRRELL